MMITGILLDTTRVEREREIFRSEFAPMLIPTEVFDLTSSCMMSFQI